MDSKKAKVKQETKQEASKPKTKKRKTTTTEANGEKIDDYGEKITGARKDMLLDYAKSLNDANLESFITLPLAKAFKRPNLKKMVETGALRKKDAQFAEAILAAYLSRSKPKALTRSRYATRQSEATIKNWAKHCADGVTLLRALFTMDEAGRDEMIEKARSIKPYKEETIAEQKRQPAEWNPGKTFTGECYPINPLKLFMDVYERWGTTIMAK